MKLYHMRDTDGGMEHFIVATNIRIAIDMFEGRYGYPPEIIRNLSADGEIVWVEGVTKEGQNDERI